MNRSTYTFVALMVVIVIAIGAMVSLTDFRGVSEHKATVTLEYSSDGYSEGEGEYKEGQQVTIQAFPYEGYHFVCWKDENGSIFSTKSSHTFVVEKNITLTPFFEKNVYKISVGSSFERAGTVSNGGNYAYGSICTLNATVKKGYEFKGCYENGRLLSNSTSYSLTVKDDHSFEARFGIIHDASFVVSLSSIKAPSTLTIKPIYTVEHIHYSLDCTNALTKNTIFVSVGGGSFTPTSFDAKEMGAIKIVLEITYRDGVTATSTQTVPIDGTFKQEYSWKYQVKEWYSGITPWWNNKSLACTYDLSFNRYYAKLTEDVSRHNPKYLLSKYITAYDPYVHGMADFILEHNEGRSDLEKVGCALKFVQSIPYEYDIDGKGVSDYWKMPLETLWEKKGDCEDHAVLLCALLEAMGYDTVIFFVECHDSNGKITGYHAATGVVVDGASGHYENHGGKRYYYCEATSPVGDSFLNNCNVGYVPTGYVVDEIWTY